MEEQCFVLVLFITSQYSASHNYVILIITRVWQIAVVIVCLSTKPQLTCGGGDKGIERPCISKLLCSLQMIQYWVES